MSGSLYSILKGKVYDHACICAGYDNAGAKVAGFKDVYEVIMADSGNPRQAQFTYGLIDILSEGHRQVLLDGLAKEYQHCEGWLAYVDRECD